MHTDLNPSDLPDRTLDSRVDASLRDALCTRPILVAGRNSSSGLRAYEYAALDLEAAANELADRHGIDVRAALPSKDQIINDLRAAPEQRLERFGGGTVKHRWVVYDFEQTAGVTFVACAGSGTQNDLEGRQPWVQVLTDLVESRRPALVYVKELHRLARVTWAAGPLLGMLQLLESWLGSEKGIVKVEDQTSMMIFFELTMASQQAAKFTPESRRGMGVRTAEHMVCGRANVGFGHTLPAGLARVRMRTSRGMPPSMVYLDGPEFRPDAREVASGLSESRDVDGNPADQVAAVEHLLATAFQPGWTRMDGVRELRRRGYSTDKLRQMRTLDATVRDVSDSIALGSIRRIFARLDFYETGELVAPIGISGFDDLVLRNCMPPGGWARPEDFARIRAGLASAPEPRRHFRFTLTGLKLDYGGEACVLRARPKTWESESVDPRPIYHLQPVDRTLRRKRARIPHAEFARFYANGIAASFDSALRLFDAEHASTSPELDRLFRKRSTLEAQHTELASQSEVLLDRIATTSGPASEALEARYNNEIHPLLEAAAVDLEMLESEVSVERARVANVVKPLAVDRLLRLVSELPDATSGEFRSLLLGTTRDIRYEKTKVTVRGTSRFDHRLTGVLRVQSVHGVVDIPLDHSWSEGALTQLDARVDELIAEIRSGVTLHAAAVRNKDAAARGLAARLGVDFTGLLLKRIRDGRISRTVLELVYMRNGRSFEQLADDLDEPVEFIERIAEVYSDPPPRWLSKGSTYLSALYVSAARHDGLAKLTDIAAWAGDKRARLTTTVREHDGDLELVYGVGYRVPPCAFCSSMTLFPMKIVEPVGVVCASCRRDRRGIVWPSDPYDRYRSEPGMWALADSGARPFLGVGRDGSKSMW